MAVRRSIIRIIFLGVVPVVALVAGADYWVASTRYVTTENAYVKTNVIQVSAEISGRVEEVFVAENGFVKAGEPIFSIDPEPFRVSFDQAEARLAMVRNDIDALRAAYRESKMELQEAKQNITYYGRVFKRLKLLLGRGNVSRASYEKAEQNLLTARQRSRAVRQKSLRLLAKLGGKDDMAPESHPEYLEAMTARASAEIDLRRTVVYAPTDGTIGRVRLQAGEYVEAGDAVMPLIETTRPWIEANLKETQLTHVRIGMTAEIVVNAYPDVTWRAKVASISPSTGAELSVLPPQNATGNWVKIVQRVPFRLEVDTSAGRAFIMPTGVTVSVSIDTQRDVSLFDMVGSALAFMAEDK
jgi:membrane fusion protein (multidrug efflux system)